MEKLSSNEISRRKPIVHGVIYGFAHNPYNLGVIDRLESRIMPLLGETGRGVLFWENAFATDHDVRNIHLEAKSDGYAGMVLKDQFATSTGRLPTREEINRIKTSLTNVRSVDEVVRRNLIRQDYFQKFFHFLLTDRLCQSYDVEVDFEVHDEKTSQRVRSLLQKTLEWEAVTLDWFRKGEIPKAVKSFEQSLGMSRKSCGIRDPRISAQLIELSQKLLAAGEETALFVLYGQNHVEYLYRSLNNRFRSNPEVLFEADYESADRLDYIRGGKFLKDRRATISVLMMRFITGGLYNYASQRGVLDQMSFTYEKVMFQILRLIENLSAEEIRDLIGSETEYESFFSQRIGPILDRLTGLEPRFGQRVRAVWGD